MANQTKFAERQQASEAVQTTGGQPATLTALQFQGPIPPPAMLAQYDQIFPGCADRILKMAERQAEHRQAMEKHVVYAKTSNERLGQILGFIVALAAIGAGVYLIDKGKNAQGLTSIITALAALVGVFVYGRYQQRKELERSREQLQTRASG